MAKLGLIILLWIIAAGILLIGVPLLYGIPIDVFYKTIILRETLAPNGSLDITQLGKVVVDDNMKEMLADIIKYIANIGTSSEKYITMGLLMTQGLEILKTPMILIGSTSLISSLFILCIPTTIHKTEKHIIKDANKDLIKKECELELLKEQLNKLEK